MSRKMSLLRSWISRTVTRGGAFPKYKEMFMCSRVSEMSMGLSDHRNACIRNAVMGRPDNNGGAWREGSEG